MNNNNHPPPHKCARHIIDVNKDSNSKDKNHLPLLFLS
jgi:hypothetical protein